MAGSVDTSIRHSSVVPTTDSDPNWKQPAILFDGTSIKRLFGNIQELPGLDSFPLSIGADVRQLKNPVFDELVDAVERAADGDGESTNFVVGNLHFEAMPISDGNQKTLVLAVCHHVSSATGVEADVNNIRKIKEADFESYSQLSEVDTDSFRCWELILKGSQGFIVLLDVDSKIRVVNKCFASHFRISPEEAIGRHFSEIVGKQRYEEISKHKMALALGGEQQLFRSEMSLPSGEVRSLCIKLYPDVAPNGTVIGVLATAINISDLIEAKNELSQVYSNFELSVKHSGVGIFELDNGRPDWANTHHIEVLLGLTPGALENSRREIRKRIHPDDVQINETTKKDRESGNNTKFEMRLLDSNDIYRWFAFAMYGNSEREDSEPNWVGTITDIDELKSSQLDSAHQVVRRDDFLAMLSHELRNPLIAIRYSVDLLTDFQKAQADSKEFVKIIGRQTTQLSRILDDLLDVAQFTKNKVEFRRDTHDLNDSIREVLETVRASFVEKQQRVTLELVDGQLLIDGDPNRIKQAMTNLLQNASKYTPTSGQIRITSDRRGNHANFCVSDSGQGVLPDDTDKIFDLFYRIENSKDRAASGMGVGLFLVKHVIEKHSGTIRVESAGIGRGSEFSFSLPLSTSNRIPVDKLDESCFDKKTVCIVEDVADARIALKILLEHRGFNVHEFADAETAVIGIPEIVPDVAIIDIGLPGKNGIELTRELRAMPAMNEVFLIALTGYGQQADCEMIDEAGFNRHIIKPAGIRDVCRVISEHFEQQRHV